MRFIADIDARNRLTSLLDDVEHGEEVTIMRRGKPVARLVPGAQGLDREKARLAAEGLKALSRGLALEGLAIRDLITEGRR